ncbi:Uncharacterized conserved protein, contains WD40 repeats [Phaffia rhodozyma]|uniref:Uncharacterized conserved protein, contains WD40 repeats n=1 Tax=Phaffia rhodozyma TaxID=264483 RepID=A0A0F7SMI6_PHARH|nr:Uncharacterized conserved protein, contains WD40 repeats [Phaffia rhodozyma]
MDEEKRTGKVHFFWDPLKTTRFVVAARGLVKLYDWQSYKRSPIELNSQSELGSITSLAWSPNSVDPFLAAATSSGSVTLLSFPPIFSSSDLKPTPSMAYLQPPRQSRTCTSLAFSTPHPGQSHLLAQGFTKARSDPCVLIWDVTQLERSHLASAREGYDVDDLRRGSAQEGTFIPLDFPSLSSSGMYGLDTGLEKIKPCVSLVPSETILDLAWMGPNLLAVSTQRQHIRLFDIRSPSSIGANPQPVIQFGGSQGAFIGGSPSMSRNGLAPANAGRMIATGLSADPFSEDRLAAYDEGPPSNLSLAGSGASLRDGIKSTLTAFGTTGGPVRVWDKRAPKNEVIKLDGPGGMLRGGALGVMWDLEKPGRLIVTEKGGGLAIFGLVSPKRRDETSELAPDEPVESLTELVVEGEAMKIPPITNASTVTLAYPGLTVAHEKPQSQIAVFTPSRGGEIIWPVIPERSPLLFSESSTLSFGPKLTIVQPPPHVSIGKHAASARHNRRISHSSESGISENSTTPYSNTVTLPDRSGFNQIHTSDNETSVGSVIEEKVKSFDVDERGAAVHRLLISDPAYVMKARAENGYGLDDLDRNATVAESMNQESLVGFWRCFKIWTRFSSDAKIGNFDFAFQGTQQLIEGFPETVPNLNIPSNLFESSSAMSSPRLRALAPTKRRGLSPSPSRTPMPRSPQSYTPPKALEYQYAMKLLNAQQRTAGLAGDVVLGVAGQTKLEQERIGALSALGWAMSADQLEQHVRHLMDEEEYERAAFCALFTGSVHRSIEALQASSNQVYLTIALTLQALISDDKPQPAKHAASLRTFRLINKVDSPYLRAVWRFGLTNDWEEVFNEDGVPLEDTLGLALMWVSDGLLKQYIRAKAASSTASGDLIGLLFTGLRTNQGLTLLQRYVNRTSDVQTAAIISAHVPNFSFKRQNPSVRWKDAYERYLLQWNLLGHRVAFKIKSAKLARDRGGVLNVPPSVYIRCNFCNKNITEVEQPNSAGGGGPRPNLTHSRRMELLTVRDVDMEVIKRISFSGSSVPAMTSAIPDLDRPPPCVHLVREALPEISVEMMFEADSLKTMYGLMVEPSPLHPYSWFRKVHLS